MNKENQNLKFAVVNMQVALELFLKYYFISIGKEEWVFKDINAIKLEFRDFSQILDRVFSSKDILISKKKNLKHILESRNNIVHRGKYNEWDDELADNIINCALFIQGLLNKEFNESLIPISYDVQNEFSTNWIWRKGAEKFAKNLAELNQGDVYECINCCSRALVDKKHFTYDEYDDEGFQCITCLRDLQLHYQIGLCKCTACGKHSFILDCLNEQEGHTYHGCCVNCGMKYFAYKCDSCEEFFLDFDNERIEFKNHIFCSEKCKCIGDKKDINKNTIL